MMKQIHLTLKILTTNVLLVTHVLLADSVFLKNLRTTSVNFAHSSLYTVLLVCLHVFKSCNFCKWIMDCTSIIPKSTLCNNCICMLTTEHKIKIEKLFSPGAKLTKLHYLLTSQTYEQYGTHFNTNLKHPTPKRLPTAMTIVHTSQEYLK